MFTNLITALSELDRERAMEEVGRLIAAGANPFDIVEKGIMQGMDVVGEKFSSGEYLPARFAASR